MTEIEQMIKDVYLWLHQEGCWHECEPYARASGEIICKKCQKSFNWIEYFRQNPEYVSPAGRVLLLKEMMASKYWSDLQIGIS